jgi:hypothetical protein
LKYSPQLNQSDCTSQDDCGIPHEKIKKPTLAPLIALTTLARSVLGPAAWAAAAEMLRVCWALPLLYGFVVTFVIFADARGDICNLGER